MAQENERRIADLKEQIEKARQLKYKYQARLEELEHTRKRLLQELAELDVRPEDLDAEIRRLQSEVEALLKEAADLLPSDLLRN